MFEDEQHTQPDTAKLAEDYGRLLQQFDRMLTILSGVEASTPELAVRHEEMLGSFERVSRWHTERLSCLVGDPGRDLHGGEAQHAMNRREIHDHRQHVIAARRNALAATLGNIEILIAMAEEQAGGESSISTHTLRAVLGID